MNWFSCTLMLIALAIPCIAGAAPLAINLTDPQAAPAPSPYGPGSYVDPSGRTITLDSQSFLLDGKPWIPILGEFHYSRYPRSEWREELLKMKADGINTISTYVFWIHQEEAEGKFDWTGQKSLRDFLLLCQSLGLKVFVRIGPWCHGEVRNGGFPDWVQNSGTKLRSTDPAYLALVKPLYAEESKQMSGLLWKDGGPVIGIQVENEEWKPDYLLKLKSMAQAAGIDVPFYAVTGWQGGLPKSELVPLFGGYSDGFWGGTLEGYRKEYFFTDVRALNDLGAQMTSKNITNSALISQFPYACVEIGGGMAVSYDRRILVDPNNVAALALSKLGNGNNMPGYYMFQGGVNPDGALSTMQEDHPNRMPEKDYDFQAPLGSAGQVRKQYHLLREQHLFLEDFGPMLARMPAFFPDISPAGLDDFSTLRWDARSDGNSGFVFFDNQQPHIALPDHPGVQFQLKTQAGYVLFPQQPITIPSGSYGIFPFNLKCGVTTLQYATAQMLCHLSDGNHSVYFFTALSGIAPELSFSSCAGKVTVGSATVQNQGVLLLVNNITPSTAPAVTFEEHGGARISFVVLSPRQGLKFWRLPIGGRDHAAISDSNLITDGNGLQMEATDPADFYVSLFPPIAKLSIGDSNLRGIPDGIFTRYAAPIKHTPAQIVVSINEVRPASEAAVGIDGTLEASWNSASLYSLTIPAAAAGRKIVLNINYIGDAARLYVGGALFDDNFYNGSTFAVPLWRIPTSAWPTIQLKVLPYSDSLLPKLAQPAIDKVNAAKAAGTLNTISVTPVESFVATALPS